MSFQAGVVEALKDWGLTVRESAGWANRGDPNFDPHGHILHHDVIAHTETLPQMLITGRPDLAGPLCNFWLPRSGVVWCVAAGEANHAGSGGWRGLSGNASVWGVEMNNLGVPSDPWPEAQLDAAARLCAATAEFSGFIPGYVAGHKEWTDRKIDPHTIDMDAFRTQVALQEKEGDLFMGAADDVIKAVNEAKASNIRQHQKDRQLAIHLAEKEGRVSKAVAAEIIGAIDRQDD